MWNWSGNYRTARGYRREPPAWNKEKEHARIERLRQQVESGQLDENPRGPLGPFNVIGILLFVISFGLAIFGTAQFLKLQAGGEWHRITATVTSTSIEKHTNSSKKDYYEIVGIYTYTVKGYEFHFRARQDAYDNLNLANAHAPDFIGSQTGVWYNPDSPAQVASFAVLSVITLAAVVGAVIVLILSGLFFSRGSPHSPKS